MVPWRDRRGSDRRRLFPLAAPIDFGSLVVTPLFSFLYEPVTVQHSDFEFAVVTIAKLDQVIKYGLSRIPEYLDYTVRTGFDGLAKLPCVLVARQK